MNNEQKFLRLLKVAIENGWKNDIAYLLYELEFGSMSIYDNRINWESADRINSYSLNDLVTNWEKGEISFIEALCRANQDAVSEFYDFALGYEGYCSPYLPASANIILMWNFDCETRKLRPTSERLDWLFKTFEHLLN